MSMILESNHGKDNAQTVKAFLVGTAVNQDGRSSALTAPNGPSQQDVIRSSLLSGGLAAGDIKHLQMHGTGTPLGDPIELGAATAVLLNKASDRVSPLELTSAKSFMGHAEPAAGIVGLSKLTLMMCDVSIDPFVSLRNMNPHVSATLESRGQTPAFGPRQVMPTGSNRASAFGGVSAFAFQGTNAHAMIQNQVCTGLKRLEDIVDLEFSRYWVLPSPSPFLHNFAGLTRKSGSARLEGTLAAQRLNHLNDHVVLGRVLLPATAMLEILLATGFSMVDGEGNLHVQDVTISAPLVITLIESQKIPDLIMQVDVLNGNCTLESRSGSALTSHAAGNYIKEMATSSVHSPKSALLRSFNAFSMNAIAESGPVGCLRMPSGVEVDSYRVPPSVADACLHLGVSVPNCPAKVPVKVERFGLGAKINNSTYCFASTTSKYIVPTSDFDTSSFSISGNEQLGPSTYIQNIETKLMGKAGTKVKPAPLADYLYELEYHQICEPAQQKFQSSVPSNPVVVLGDEDGSQSKFSICAGEEIPYLGCASMLSVIQGIDQNGVKSMHACMMDSVNVSSVSPGQGYKNPEAAIEGLLRVFASERRGSKQSLTSTHENDAHMPMLQSGKQASLKLWQNSLSKPMLLRSRALMPSQDLVQLRSNPRGSLNNLACQAFEQTKIRPNDVSISVKAVGINFRDVLNVLGMYPGDPGPPGSDCAGVVLETGDNVAHLKRGDAVFGLAHGCLGTAVSGPAAMVVQMPSNLSFVEAATIPTVFTTVHIAFDASANLQKGEKVLIHASAGGVGLAGVQIANSMGAEVISTAGGPGKRSLLHNLGVKHVLGSRDTNFAEDICMLGGADVVLNSLTSSGMIGASVASLNRGGRFVEISKRDIWSTSRFQQERGDINYALLAVDFLPPSVLNSTLQKIANELATGQIKPLRQISHPMGSVANAMRQLSQATHVGKVVTTVDTLGDGFGQNPTLTISGGVGGLGVMLTDWISRRYSNCAINLLGRSGKVQVSSIWKQLMDSGAKIMVALVDTSSAEDIEALLQNTPAVNFVHASGILRDSLLEKQNLTSFKQVFAPKTAILQGNFAALPIENLTLFSSVASLLGGAGQGNYAAANSCLDSSALAAQNMGFNVKAIQWGAWASSGMASESVLKRLNRIGQGLITAEQGLSAMRSILSLSMNHPRPVLTVNGFDWKTYLKNFEHPGIFSEFYDKGESLLTGILLQPLF